MSRQKAEFYAVFKRMKINTLLTPGTYEWNREGMGSCTFDTPL
jgi:hypothetical protein